jgi:hypothetical protein
MKNIYFIESAMHNRKAFDKSLRNLTVLILVCAIVAAVCRVFFWEYTHEALVTSWRYKHIRYIADVGWPATVYTWGSRFAMAFIVIYVYYRYKQDLRKPSFGVSDDGIFINQQTLYNAFVPWQNIQKAELLGPAESPFMRLTFKDYTALLKGQPFILKSIAKANFKNNPVLSITKGETVGNIRRMHEIIQEKTAPAI